MKLPLSSRLDCCCRFVHPGDRVADVGCDHGYLGIHLLLSGIASGVIASDVNEKPLLRAMDNARRFGVSDKMSFYRSDGVRSIPRNFDCLVCAGMGADTMISILNAAPWLRNAKYRLILQCQSKRPALREYLAREGFSICRETLAKDGKFLYTVMEAVYAPGAAPAPWEYYISRPLAREGSSLLPEFLARVITGLEYKARGAGREDETGEILRQLCRLQKELAYDNRE